MKIYPTFPTGKRTQGLTRSDTVEQHVWNLSLCIFVKISSKNIKKRPHFNHVIINALSFWTKKVRILSWHTINFVTFTVTVTVTFKALYFNVPTLQGKGHKIRLQGRLKSKVTWWDSIVENAYSLWKYIMQNSNPG